MCKEWIDFGTTVFLINKKVEEDDELPVLVKEQIKSVQINNKINHNRLLPSTTSTMGSLDQVTIYNAVDWLLIYF